jgi:ABC-2 type transport system ATP-binding protein
MVTLAKKDYKKSKLVFAENEKIFNVKFKRSKKIKQFSAGERKILSALMILVLKPEVIFFDEPTANLDLKNKEIIINIIKLMKTDDRIIVITTHLIDEVKELLTDLIILDQGKITYAEPYDQRQDLRVIFNQHTTEANFNYNELQKNLNS